MATRRTRNNDKDLLIELVKARFKLRYNNSVLGFVWVLLKPFSYFLILYFVFSEGQVIKTNDQNFAVNLFLGLIIYLFFLEGINFGMNSLMDMAGVILKINFPRHLAVLSSLVMAIINFTVNFFIVIIIATVFQFRPHLIGTLYCFFVIFVEVILIYSISMILSIVLIKVRDLTHIMELFFQLLFYASAVFYTLDTVQGSTGELIRMNPLAIMIDAARKSFVLNQITHVNEMMIILVVALVLMIIARMFFNIQIKKVAEYF